MKLIFRKGNKVVIILSFILVSFIIYSFTFDKNKDTKTKYYLNTTISLDMEQATDKVIAELKKEGFGIATQFDVDKVFKEKLDIDFRKYRILGACNSTFALRSIKTEDKIGTIIPCNVMLQEVDGGTEIAIINPVAMVASIDNDEMKKIADEIYIKLMRVLSNL